jgi:hypothetical protein
VDSVRPRLHPLLRAELLRLDVPVLEAAERAVLVPVDHHQPARSALTGPALLEILSVRRGQHLKFVDDCDNFG